jgi:hypothetical protein
MPNADLMTDSGEVAKRAPWRAWLEIALVFAIFFLHGAWPTPDVNETGYLTKAAHYWNHEAFANDFFCQSGDAHTVFYWAFGWLTTLGWPLATVAWIGRIITWLMLAAAWRGLSYAVLPKPWLAILSAELFVLLTEQTHMAGEWIVGGVEAKGFAWALVLCGVQAALRNRWNWAWPLLGIATALHVVVGGWSTVCLGIVWITSRHKAPIKTMLPGLIGYALLAGPGLWFATRVDKDTDWLTRAEAARIQVFERLPHHLFPPMFQPGYVPRQLLLWTIFAFLCVTTESSESQRRLRWFVSAAMGIAMVGFFLAAIASLGPTTTQSDNLAIQSATVMLRFYWFRLSDIAVPIGVSLVGLQFLARLVAARKPSVRWIGVGLSVLVLYDGWNQAQHFSNPLDTGHRMTRADRDDSLDDAVDIDNWREVCLWAADKTPPGTIFITPMNSSTFKWYSGRDEVATWKDMPQDARGVVEWWRRINELFATGNQDPDYRWRKSLAELNPEQLRALGAKFGAQYVIVPKLPESPRLYPSAAYSNSSYAVYQLDRGAEASNSTPLPPK